MEDKVIEIAQFDQTAEAEMLASLLKSEGIECFVRDDFCSHIMSRRVDIGGAKVDLLKKDALRALEIMKDHGYEISEELREILILENAESDSAIADNDNITEDDESEDSEIEQDNDEDVNKKAKLSKHMTIIIVLMAILFGLLVFLNKYYNG